MCDLEVCADVDVGVWVEAEVELVSVIVTVVTTTILWIVVCGAVVELLSVLVVMGTVGGNRS